MSWHPGSWKGYHPSSICICPRCGKKLFLSRAWLLHMKEVHGVEFDK